MTLSMLSVVLALLIYPLDVVPPSVHSPDTTLPLYTSTMLVASPFGRTGLASLHLNGPVAETRVERISPTGDSLAPWPALETLLFDAHGNITEMTNYRPKGMDGNNQHLVAQTTTMTHQYDEQQQLQHTTLTTALPRNIKIEAERTYNADGRLYAITATATDLSANPQPSVHIRMPVTYNAKQRLVDYQLLVQEDAQVHTLLKSAYRQDASGRTVLALTSPTMDKMRCVQYFDARDRLCEWRMYNESGKVERKFFFSYTPQGDLQRINGVSGDETVRMEYDGYLYDDHANWTERTLYRLETKDGKTQRTPCITEKRAIRYDAQANAR